MTNVSSLFPRKMIAAADGFVDQAECLRNMGLDPEASTDVETFVSNDAYLGLLENLAEREPNAVSFHLRAGATMRCDDYGVIGMALKAAPTLLDSYLRWERYGQMLVGESAYSVDQTETITFMRINRINTRRGMRLSNEAAISTFWSLGKDSTGESFTPVCVHYQHPADGDCSHYADFFGCPVHFNSQFNGLGISPETARLPNRVGDSTIVKYFDERLDERIEQSDLTPPWRNSVRDEIARALSGGVPRKSDIARCLGVSDRTLLRRLADDGLSFQHIVEETQRNLAKQLLGKTQLSLTEVAFMTGFSDQSTFSRAFKRWAGQTPRSYRLGI